MKLDPKQLHELTQLAFTTNENDTLGCDGCNELLDQLAQAKLDGQALDETLTAVLIHIEQCKCCRDEYHALLTALRALDER